MRDYETLKVVHDKTVLTVFLNRPESRHAISMQMVRDLADLMDEVEDADDVEVFVLRGSPDFFCSGIDLRDFAIDKHRDVYGLQKWEQVASQLENLNKFTVAAVQGECVGGGFQLTLLCDARLADRTATFCLNEVRLGFLPGMALYRLSKYVGLGRAKSLVLSGRTLQADEALAWGIADAVADPGSMEEALADVVQQALPFHPVALQTARRLLNESYASSYEDFLGCFLAAQHRAINAEPFGRLVAGSLLTDSRQG